jgi:glycosyltransferase involved in cell wall biosynthesis
MHVCSILTSLSTGGAEMLVGNLSREFVKLGHQATVVTLADAAQVGNSAPIEAQLAAQLEEAGVTYRSLSLGGGRNLFAGFRAIRRLLPWLKPDVIHSHTARAGLMLSLVRAAQPVVLTHHNTRLSFSPRLFPLLDATVDAYVAISVECSTILRRHSRRPVELILNGVDASFRAEQPRRSVAKDPLILAVGMLNEQKDYPTLIRAARPLARAVDKQGRKVKVRIIGGGPLMPDLQRLVEAEQVSEIVELAGIRTDVREQLSQADLFVNSSAYEGMPIAVIEAMMSALPVVATDVPGNRELVRHGSTGLLVPQGQPEELASAIAEAVKDQATYAAFSEAALKLSENYALEPCAAAHLRLYERLLHQSRPPPLRRPERSTERESAHARRV